MDAQSRRRVGDAGLAAAGTAGLAVALLWSEVGLPYAVLFTAVAAVGAAGLAGNARRRTGALAAGAAVSLVASVSRFLQYGVELLAALLLVLGLVLAARGVEQYRVLRAA